MLVSQVTTLGITMSHALDDEIRWCGDLIVTSQQNARRWLASEKLLSIRIRTCGYFSKLPLDPEPECELER